MLRMAFSINAGSAKAVAEQMRPERMERILVQSLRKRLGPVVDDVRAGAPVGTTSITKGHLAGLLKRSIRLMVDLRRGLRARILAAPHAHLVEDGHRQVIGRGPRKGTEVGRVQAHPFVRPTIEAALPEIEQGLSQDVERALLLAARIGKATGRGL